MIEAIDKYGYDNIPEEVAEQINALHDDTMNYEDFKL